MKKRYSRLSFLAVLYCAVSASVCGANTPVNDSKVPPELQRFIARLPGKYAIDNPISWTRGEIDLQLLKDDRLTMTIVSMSTDISGKQHCTTRVGGLKSLNLRSDPDAFAEADFGLISADCPWIAGPITFHYNKSLLGTDVYLIDVLIKKGFPTARGAASKDDIQRWSLKKIP